METTTALTGTKLTTGTSQTQSGKEKMVSIIIPVYNVSKYLPECLESIFSQTYTNWEAICVNDGSTDNSLEILKEYAARDKRIKIIDGPNAGISCARNTAMLHASGEYVMYVDSDDFIHPQTLEIAFALMERDDSDIVSWYRSKYFTSSGRPKNWDRRWDIQSIRSLVTDDVVSKVTELNNPFIHMPIKHFYIWRYLFKIELVRDIDFIPHLKYEDFPWCCEVMLRKPRTTITNLRLYYYRRNPTSTTRRLKGKTMEKMEHWLKGFDRVYSLYSRKADSHQMEQWTKNCMWPVVKYHFIKPLRHMTAEERETAWTRLKEMELAGMFDKCKGLRSRLIKRKLMAFLHMPLAEIKARRTMLRRKSSQAFR
jgi:Glycosyltransferases involved in cell wall biogenesis